MVPRRFRLPRDFRMTPPGRGSGKNSKKPGRFLVFDGVVTGRLCAGGGPVRDDGLEMGGVRVSS